MKRKIAYLGAYSSSLNKVKSERQGKGALVKKGLVVIIHLASPWRGLVIRR